jgi:pimeloyl-ACP methyl ester carboxylesterase
MIFSIMELLLTYLTLLGVFVSSFKTNDPIKDMKQFSSIPNLVWYPCKDLLCTNIKVPLNHNDPEEELIDIEISKLPAPNQPALKTIIIHPDGPGIDGIEFLSKNGKLFSKVLGDKVDIIGFNHRGTKSITCGNPKESYRFLKELQNFSLHSNWSKGRNINKIKGFDQKCKNYADLCAKTMGELLAYTTTPDIAKDLELIRIALGMRELNYWSFGYGTVLGATFANMFPESVGRMILDGPFDPKDYYSSFSEYARIIKTGFFTVVYEM